jgi:hypothetical protein
MVTQSLFLLPSSKLLRVATLSAWRKGAAPTDTGDRAGRAICMGVVPIRVDIMGGEGGTAAHPAIGVARGVTAATRRSTEGIRTGRGIRARVAGVLSSGQCLETAPCSSLSVAAKPEPILGLNIYVR